MTQIDDALGDEFDDFIHRFPRRTTAPSIQRERPAFVTDTAAIPGFVKPNIQPISWPRNATVVLVQAAGAVGKSSAAHAIAAVLNWPLVLTQAAQVGDYSLTGLIQDALGFDTEYLQEITSGRAGIVIDSLDEAHAKAGTQNFIAFMDNIITLASTGANNQHPTIILLSRVETAELIQLCFEEHQSPLAIVEISYFSLAAARSFIIAHLQRRFDETGQPEYNIANTHAEPFGRLLDARFTQALRTLLSRNEVHLESDWDDAKEFLGYSPVLIALAEAVAVRNPASELSEISSQTSASEEELFSTILESILSREHEKFAETMTDMLSAFTSADDASDFSAAHSFTPEEQLARIACWTREAEMASEPPAQLPQSLRGRYESNASQFISEHPFVRGRGFASVIFADYVRAYNTTNIASLSMLRATSPEMPGPGPFFTLFLRKLLPKPCTIPERLVEPVIQSWQQEMQGRPAGQHYQAYLSLMDDSGALYLIDTNGGRQRRAVIHSFRVTDTTGALQLRNLPRATQISTNGALILGSRKSPLSLGSESLVIADTVSLDCESIDPRELRSASPCIILTKSLEADYLTANHTTRDNLLIFADQVPLTLRSSLAAPLPPGGIVEIQASDVISLRSVLTAFTPTVHYTGPCVPRELIERVTIKDDALRSAILKELITRGVVTEQSGWLILQTDQLAHVGLNLKDVKRCHVTPAMKEFLAPLKGNLGPAPDRTILG